MTNQLNVLNYTDSFLNDVNARENVLRLANSFIGWEQEDKQAAQHKKELKQKSKHEQIAFYTSKIEHLVLQYNVFMTERSNLLRELMNEKNEVNRYILTQQCDLVQKAIRKVKEQLANCKKQKEKLYQKV